jgi:hypothetical protein
VQNNEAADARLTRDIALAVSGSEHAPYTMELAEERIYETSRPGKLEIPLRAVRRGDFKGTLALAAVGLPKDIKINNVNFSGDQQDAVLQLDVTTGAPLGTYSFYFTATGEVSYQRDSEKRSKSDKIVVVEPVLPITIRIAAVPSSEDDRQ